MIIDNINRLLGDDLKHSILPRAKLRIAASCFSIYAYEALKDELERIDSLHFVFTSPTFVPNEVTDKLRKEHREFHIPRLERERGFYGSEFEIRLKNKLTQRAIARECAEWMRRKAVFRSNHGKAASNTARRTRWRSGLWTRGCHARLHPLCQIICTGTSGTTSAGHVLTQCAK